MPVVRVDGRAAAAVHLLAVAAHVDGQALQIGADFGGARQGVRIAAVGRGAAVFIGDITIPPLAQEILGRLGDEGHAAAQAGIGAAGSRRTRIDAHFAERFRVKIITARGEGVEGVAVRLGRRVRQRDAIELQADPVAFQAADVVTGITRTIPHAAAARGRRWRGNQRQVAHDAAHVRDIAALQVIRRDDRLRAGAAFIVLLGVDNDFRKHGQLGRLLRRRARVDGGILRANRQQRRGEQAQQGCAQHQVVAAGGQVSWGYDGCSGALQKHCSHDDPV